MTTPSFVLTYDSLTSTVLQYLERKDQAVVNMAVPVHYLRLLRLLFSMSHLAVAWVWQRIYEGSERRDQPWECHGRMLPQ